MAGWLSLLFANQRADAHFATLLNSLIVSKHFCTKSIKYEYTKYAQISQNAFAIFLAATNWPLPLIHLDNDYLSAWCCLTNEYQTAFIQLSMIVSTSWSLIYTSDCFLWYLFLYTCISTITTEAYCFFTLWKCSPTQFQFLPLPL